MFILDSLLIDGLGFVFDKIRVAAEAEQDDDSREALFDAQARLESGELSEVEYVALERDVLERLAADRRRRQGGREAIGSKVAGVEIQFTGDDDRR